MCKRECLAAALQFYFLVSVSKFAVGCCAKQFAKLFIV